MSDVHMLQQPSVIREIERATSAHLAKRWVASRFTDLDEHASHPCALLHGEAFSVFAKLDPAATGGERLAAELDGLNLLRDRTSVLTPAPIAGGVIETDTGWMLLLEAMPEISPQARTGEQWQSIGRSLAMLHQVHDERFGLDQFDGFFGPLHQDNRPVSSNQWVDFYAERRLLPGLRSAVDSGYLPDSLSAGVEGVVTRLASLCGPPPRPSLLHGDAQQNNFLVTATDAVLVDVAPYFGHPEIDLALVDYFAPVPAVVFDAYHDITPIDPQFAQRRELWRLFAYLAVVTVDGTSAFGHSFLDRIADVVSLYR